MAEKKIPGLSLAIIENAEVVVHLELGLKNAQNKDPIVADTLFEAASLSKPVFAYGVLKLVESDKLNLDTPLSEYLVYQDIKDDKRLEYITARMVLAHSSGFPNWRPKTESLKIHFQPGERFSYSGEGFLYLQRVVEHLSGLSLEEYMVKNVFIPLGMNHSTYKWVNNNEKASGHDVDGHPIESRKEIPQNAAFTLHTTSLDYAKFVIACLKDVGLKPETFIEMLKPQIVVHEGNSISWGLGWGLQRTTLDTSFWHWGDNEGFKSFVVGSKSRKQAIILFTNSSNGLSLISEVVQEYLGIPQPAFKWLDEKNRTNSL